MATLHIKSATLGRSAWLEKGVAGRREGERPAYLINVAELLS